VSHESLRAAYDELLRARAPRDRTGCPSPEALLALVERRGSEAERLATLDHVMGCERCHGDVDLLRLAADAARETSGEARTGEANAEERTLTLGRGGAAVGRSPFRIPRWAAIAAGLVIAVGLGVIARRPDTPETPQQGAVLRGAEPTVALLPAERAPGPAGAPGTMLRWRTVPGAAEYRVEVFGASGGTLKIAEVRDTAYFLFDEEGLRADPPPRWMVTAVRANGGEVLSPSAPLPPLPNTPPIR
jgi:hypothetical protein